MSVTQLNPRLLSWAGPELEQQAVEQAERCSRLPFVDGHVALMPDAHWGLGATVGSVIPTRDAVIPSAVGVDIGCGMIAARLNLTANDLPDDLKPLHSQIDRDVPAGVGKGHTSETRLVLPDTASMDHWTPRLITRAMQQFGSLGSGNHFIEVCLDERDHVWLVLHSGSRGVGNELAKVHIAGAKALMKQHFVHLEDPDLAYLVAGTPEFDAYITDMHWAQEYAMGNRSRMLALVLGAVRRFVPRAEIVEQINCHHNFSQLERHGGKDLWITRKGAIKADIGDRGVIPGSMGTRSYIVSGLGSTAAYCSCSHGAGRRMSRGKARKTLDPAGLVRAMAGKVWNEDPKALIDEDPRAYKDIDEVMDRQSDLVTIDHTLRQLLNYKGT
ncbi:MAG: RtcB family protein [Ilumatobacteraceae bacterium]